MLSILERPNGPGASSFSVNSTYSITTNGYGTAVLSGGSGLANNDRIFIYNALDTYRGFWVVTSYGPSQFRLQRYTGGDYLDYTAASTTSIIVHNTSVPWSCVHLPIVYTLSSNLWPVNSSDTIRTITGFANDNGFVRITLSGSIVLDELDWMNIQATSEDDLDGPFQILNKYSNTQYTINAPYSLAASPYTYAGATAQKYYNNYHSLIKVWGGLNPSHTWSGLKPYELITTLKMVPDSEGLIKVNIAEIIKQKIQVLKNRPNYDTMPYDLDRFSQFYIEYAEAYDDSDGIEVESSVQAHQSDYDFFQGYAVDAKLEFKNRYSGFMSNYQYMSVQIPAKFLTNVVYPSYWFGKYFDLSILTQGFTGTVATLHMEPKDENGNSTGGTIGATTCPVSSSTAGVARFNVSEYATEGAVASTTAYLDCYIVDNLGGSVLSEVKRIVIERSCYDQYIYLTWKNNLGGFNYWLFISNKDHQINVLETQEKDRNIYPEWPKSYDESQDSISQETSRTSRRELVVRAENLSKDQVDFISSIKTSALVQQVTSKYDRRTMKVDNAGFTVRTDNEKLHTIEFSIIYTDEVPSQSL